MVIVHFLKYCMKTEYNPAFYICPLIRPRILQMKLEGTLVKVGKIFLHGILLSHLV